MIETPPLSQMLAAPPRRDWRIGMTAAASALVHLGILGWLLLPALQPLQPPAPPAPINVELVPPSAASSTPPPPSSEMPSSSEPPSSSEEPVSSEQPSMEPASSGASEPASSAPESSAASEASASAASAAPASGVSEAAAPPSAPSEAPVPAPPRPILIPVAPDEPSSTEMSASAETSTSEMSAASEVTTSSAPPEETPSALSTNDPGADALALASSASAPGKNASEASSEEPPPPPVIDGALHVAKRFYLANMLRGPAMANAREAIKKLPPQKRLVQTCNIEAIAQIGQATDHQPDAIVADAFAPTQPSERTFKVSAGAFRSNKRWYAVSYDCTLSKDLSKVQSFSFRVGDEVALPGRAPAQAKRDNGG